MWPLILLCCSISLTFNKHYFLPIPNPLISLIIIHAAWIYLMTTPPNLSEVENPRDRLWFGWRHFFPTSCLNEQSKQYESSAQYPTNLVPEKLCTFQWNHQWEYRPILFSFSAKKRLLFLESILWTLLHSHNARIF